MDPRLLSLYETELAFMREMGTEFAREFPKIAARLDLANFDVVDPYVERLMEGFAFLAARIQLKLQSEFPTFTQSLLQMVYPHYYAPTPSMAVVRFEPDAALRGMPQGMLLPRGLELRSLLGTEDQTHCTFRTARPVQLLPISISEAEYIPSPAALASFNLPDHRGVKAAIRLRLKTADGIPFEKLTLDNLVFFLGGPDASRVRLYEQLVANLDTIYVRPATRPAPWQLRLPPGSLRGLGFAPEEALLPALAQSFDGYRLLQEYYAMPERLLFIEIDGLTRPAASCASPELDIILLLNRSEPALAAGLGPDHFLLFCTPVINLFPRRGDRLNVVAGEVEQLLIADRMRPLDFEIFGVSGVEAYAADGSAPQRFFPFYYCNDLGRSSEARRYYTLRREPRLAGSAARLRGSRSNYLGHDVYISLVDAEAAPDAQGVRQLGLDLLVTNRDLPLSMPIGKQHTDFTLTVSAPVAAVRCVAGPTPPRPARGDAAYAWRFISHLGLNYLSLVDTDRVQGAAALRELLGLYITAPGTQQERQLEALLSVEAHPIVRRIPGAGPIAAGRGLEIRLTMDEAPFGRAGGMSGGSGAILLAGVLSRFFAKYVSINSFTETVLISSDRGEVMRWSPEIGRRPLI